MNDQDINPNKKETLIENFSPLLVTLRLLQLSLVITIPLFVYLYKEDFLFFLPLVFVIIFRFKLLKDKIKEGTNSEELVYLIKRTALILGVLWFVELIFYLLIIYIS